MATTKGARIYLVTAQGFKWGFMMILKPMLHDCVALKLF